MGRGFAVVLTPQSHFCRGKFESSPPISWRRRFLKKFAIFRNFWSNFSWISAFFEKHEPETWILRRYLIAFLPLTYLKKLSKFSKTVPSASLNDLVGGPPKLHRGTSFGDRYSSMGEGANAGPPMDKGTGTSPRAIKKMGCR